MIKHVGRQGDRKVAVIFREIPGEEHMCLVAYPDQLQQNLHDDLMNAINSDKGQNAKTLADALHGITGVNGKTILNSLHSGAFMKKVRTQDVIMVPSPNQRGARLDEINKIINDMDAGGEAARKMANLNATAGMADPDKTAAGRLAGDAASGVLDDTSIARNLLQQAETMESQKLVLESEIVRLKEEAYSLDPASKPKNKGGRPKKNAKVSTEAPVKETHDTLLAEEKAHSLSTSADDIAKQAVNLS
jgi:hypothetical protein